MTRSQFQALKNLGNDSELIIKPSDKGGNVIIWSKEEYVKKSAMATE